MAARSAHEHPCALDPCGRSRRLATAGVAHARRLQSLARTNWAPPNGRRVTTSTLAARIDGDAGTTVVLLHGLVASGMYWGGAYATLARRHRLVVPDLLGFGRSPRPPSGYGPDDHVRALLARLEELDVSEPDTVLTGRNMCLE